MRSRASPGRSVSLSSAAGTLTSCVCRGTYLNNIPPLRIGSRVGLHFTAISAALARVGPSSRSSTTCLAVMKTFRGVLVWRQIHLPARRLAAVVRRAPLRGARVGRASRSPTTRTAPQAMRAAFYWRLWQEDEAPGNRRGERDARNPCAGIDNVLSGSLPGPMGI